jgi:hypothetical protein
MTMRTPNGTALPPGQLAELESILSRLIVLLARRRELSVQQRAAVGAGDLPRLLALTAEQEENDARLQHLEGQRRALQQALEEALGVRGLIAVVRAGYAAEADAHPLLGLVELLRQEVVRLHEENGRCAALLASAITLVQRNRRYLQQFAGAEPTYSRLGAGGPGVTPPDWGSTPHSPISEQP